MTAADANGLVMRLIAASNEVTDKRKWRMGWDSNPRWALTHAGFQDRCIQPLCHPSVDDVLALHHK